MLDGYQLNAVTMKPHILSDIHILNDDTCDLSLRGQLKGDSDPNWW